MIINVTVEISRHNWKNLAELASSYPVHVHTHRPAAWLGLMPSWLQVCALLARSAPTALSGAPRLSSGAQLAERCSLSPSWLHAEGF